MDKPDFVMSIFIRCTRDALWDALSDPDAWRQFHFLTDRLDQDDDTFRYSFPDGRPMLDCRLLEAEPKTRMVTTFEPRWEGGGDPSRVVYRIASEGDHCRLTLEHYGLTFPVVPGEGVADGWERTLSGLKTWLETGQSARFAHA